MSGEKQAALALLRAQFKAKIDAGLKCIEVPEIKDAQDKPLRIFYGPENTLHRDAYGQLLGERKASGWVQVLIQRARHEDGSAMFSSLEHNELAGAVDPDIIQRVAIAILSDKPVAVDEAKNS